MSLETVLNEISKSIEAQAKSNVNQLLFSDPLQFRTIPVHRVILPPQNPQVYPQLLITGKIPGKLTIFITVFLLNLHGNTTIFSIENLRLEWAEMLASSGFQAILGVLPLSR